MVFREVNQIDIKGVLNKDFYGPISYEINLMHDYKRMNFELSFTNIKAEDWSEDNIAAIRESYFENVGEYPSSEIIKKIVSLQKGEIQLLIYNNEDLLGSCHRNDDDKKVTISEDFASEGFNRGIIKKGLLKVVVYVISIIKDGTEYSLKINGEKDV